MAALKLTVICSLIVVAINAVFGTIIAWVLVRDEFPGKGGRQRADRPALRSADDRRWPDPADPLRSGQPVRARHRLHQGRDRRGALLHHPAFRHPRGAAAADGDGPQMEEAATSLGAGGFTVFRRIIFPNLLPGILAGVLLAFARALGEYGSLILISGNIPFKTEVSSVFIRSQIESGNVAGASAVSVVLLAISLLLLIAVSLFARWGTRITSQAAFAGRQPHHRPQPDRRGADELVHVRQVGPAHPRPRLPRPAAARPGRDDLLQDVRTRHRTANRGDDLARRAARDLADPVDGRRRRPPQHHLRGRLRAAARPPQVEGQRADRRRSSTCHSRSPRSSSASPCSCSTATTAGSARRSPNGASRSSSRPRG